MPNNVADKAGVSPPCRRFADNADKHGVDSAMKTFCPVRCRLAFLVLALSAALCRADDWPQFRGPNRDGKSAETGLLKKWPDAGPAMLWSFDELGIGYSSVAVADGLVYTTGMIDNQGFLFAFDLAGNLKWRQSYGPEWTGSQKGTRTTPTVDGDRIYVFSGTGVMTCLNAKTGHRIWQRDIITEFDGKKPRWGMSGSPLIDGPRLYCTPGGTKGTIVAVDKMTGQTIWAATGVNELSAYCSPILVQQGPSRLLINMIQKSVIAVNPDTGKFIWRFPYEVSYDTGIVTPIYKDGQLFVTSVVEEDFNDGGVMLELSPDGSSVEKKWNCPTLDCHHGGLVLVDGYLYGSNFDDVPRGNWVCVDWNTGKVMYEATWNGNKGSIIYADGMLYCYDENTGDLALVKPNPNAFQIISSFRITKGSGKHWAHPAISNGRLYIRHGESLMAFDIKAPHP
jgi:outer membrane protein assembly factor BamB